MMQGFDSCVKRSGEILLVKSLTLQSAPLNFLAKVRIPRGKFEVCNTL
jgi:hypothetical protein